MPAACSRRSSASRTTTCSATTSTEHTPRMVQYLFNVQREIGRNSAIEIGYLGSRSYQLERMFDRNDVIPGPGAVQDKRPYPEFTRVQTIGNVAEAQVQLADGQADAAPQQRVLGARRLHALEIRGQRQRHPHAQRRSAVPAEQQLRGGRSQQRMRVGPLDLRRPAPRRLVDPLRAAVRRRARSGRRIGVGGAILGGWQFTNIMSLSSGFPRNPNDRAGSREPGSRRSETECRVRSGSERWTEDDSAVVQHRGICAAAGQRYGDAVRNQSRRTGDLQLRHVDPAELHASAAARACSSGSRRSIRSTSPSGRIRTRR